MVVVVLLLVMKRMMMWMLLLLWNTKTQVCCACTGLTGTLFAFVFEQSLALYP